MDGTAPTDLTQPTRLPAGGPNAIGHMLGLLGDEWTLLILQQALQGVTRYGQLKDALPISNSVLTARLRSLCEAQLLERHVYQSNPERAEYLTTPRSRSLWPVMLAIWEWERQWVPEHPAPLPAMHHGVCGHDFAPVVVCQACGKPFEPREVVAEWGPSGSWARSVPQATTRRRWEPEAGHHYPGLFPETMAIFGNRWSSALMGAAFRGVTRFTDFEANLGAPPTLVADRLRSFCAIGVLEPRANPDRPDWAEYGLTPKGRAFYPVIAASIAWAEHWFVSPEGPAVVQHHRTCGEELTAIFTCDQCERPLAGNDVTVVPADDARDRHEGEA
jgi:DNA-binding HxlR family transcriptional regulator